MKTKILLFNIFLLVFYFSVLFSVGFSSSPGQKMFSSHDSREYLEMGNWIFGSSVSCSPVRPFLYPFFLHICYLTGGVYGIWFMQFVMYAVSVNLIFLSLLKITGRYSFAFLSSLLLASNITFIILTMHALSEVTVIFILSCYVYFVTHHLHKRKQFDFFCMLVLFASVLTAVKPVFNLLFLILVLVIFPLGYLRSFWKEKYSLLKLIAVALPLVIQTGIMKKNYDTFSISKIGEITLRDYYYKQLFANVNHVEIDVNKGADSISVATIEKEIRDAGTDQIVDYIFNHPKEAWKTYLQILHSNLDHSEFTSKTVALDEYMKNLNFFYRELHLLFIPLILYVLYRMRKKLQEEFYLVIALLIPCVIIFLTSGISFWQGDRVVLPALPLFVTLYAFVLSYVCYPDSIPTTLPAELNN